MPELTLEQQFEYRGFTDAVKDMSRVQALENLINAERLSIIKNNVIEGYSNSEPFKPHLFNISVDQEFAYVLKVKEYQGMNKKEVISALLDKMTQLMEKDNIIRALMKHIEF